MDDTSSPGVRVTFDLDENEDVTATVADLGDEHGVQLSSIFSLHHHDRRTGDRWHLGVVRLRGVSERFLDALWRSYHRVLSVVETPGREPAAAHR